MSKQQVDGFKSDKKIKSRNPIIEFDQLQMYFGDPYVIDIDGCDGKITLYQPTIGDIVAMGERNFYSSLSVLTSNTTSYRLQLWEAGIDWNEISDFQLFSMMYKGIDPSVDKLLFGENSLLKFEPFEKKNDDGEPYIVLYDVENKIEINETVYFHISQYYRNVFNMFPEEKMTKQDVMKQWFIDKDRRELENAKNKSEEPFSIQPIISACVNHPGFKYNLKQLKDVGVCQFYDSVQRLQIYESSTALLKGMYSGMIDAKGINSEEYNFMRKISK